MVMIDKSTKKSLEDIGTKLSAVLSEFYGKNWLRGFFYI